MLLAFDITPLITVDSNMHNFEGYKDVGFSIRFKCFPIH